MYTFQRSQVEINYLEILSNNEVVDEIFFPLKIAPPSSLFATKEDLLAWLQSSSLAKAKAAAYKLLSMRSYSSKMLANKLQMKGFSEDVVSQVVDRVVSEGYIQDQEGAVCLIEKKLRSGVGPLMIEKYLVNAGYNKALAKSISAEDQLKAIFKWERRLRLMDRKSAFAFLFKKGFPPEIINQALDAK